MNTRMQRNDTLRGALSAVLLSCALGIVSPLAFSQEQGRRTQPEAKVAEPAAATVRKLVVAPPSASIPDRETLIRTLMPYSAPPESLVVVLPDGTSGLVRNLEWAQPQGNPANQKQKPGMRYCDCGGNMGRHLCPDSWTCADCCALIKKVLYDTRMFPKDRQQELDEVLSEAGLKRATARRQRPLLPINFFSSDPSPDQTITCMAKDAQGNCTHWRICMKLDSGIERCWDVIKDPLLGWAVAWK